MQSLKIVSLGLVFVATLMGCIGDAFTSGDPPDSGDSGNTTEGSAEAAVEAGDDSDKVGDPDGSTPGPEAGGPDAENSEQDSGMADSSLTDAGSDVVTADSGSPDATDAEASDAGADTGTDAGTDAGMDAGADAAACTCGNHTNGSALCAQAISMFCGGNLCSLDCLSYLSTCGCNLGDGGGLTCSGVPCN